MLDEYYKAEVKAHRVVDSQCTETTLVYEDGEEECIDLWKEKIMLAEKPKPAKSTVVEVAKPSKRKRILDSDDEEEFEFDEDNGDDDEYVEAEHGSTNDDDDDMDSFVVDEEEEEEDDDDEEKVTKTKRQRVKPTSTLSRTQSSKPQPAFLSPSPRSSSLSRPPSSLSSFQLKKGNSSPSSRGSTVITPNRLLPEANGTPLRQHSPKVCSPSPVAALPYTEGAVNPFGAHIHNHYSFLHPDKIRDINKNPKGHPNYSKRTLHVDYSEITRRNSNKAPSPAQLQWWETKAQYFDCVLLFKTGKFYEMFHMDADIGVQVCNFRYMKGKEAHAGFPEAAYGVMSAKLLAAGYKVARCEQTETPDGLAQRKKETPKGVKKPMVVNREVCSVLSAGTRTMCYLDAPSSIENTINGGEDYQLLSIKQVKVDFNEDSCNEADEIHPVVEYGVCLIDPIRSTVTLGQFADDILHTRLRTLITTNNPGEILIENSNDDDVNGNLVRLIKASAPTAVLEILHSIETVSKSTAIESDVRRQLERPTPAHPWDAQETLAEINRRGYFDKIEMPEILNAVVEGGATLAQSALGGALFYLQRHLIDHEVMTMGQFQGYVPPDQQHPEESNNAGKDVEVQPDKHAVTIPNPFAPLNHRENTANETFSAINHMTLDGTTLLNLEILTNSTTGTVHQSLFHKINHTKTPHGCRLLRAWLLRPLFQRNEIERRCDAVSELMNGSAALALSEAMPLLTKLPDLERLLSRVHSMGIANDAHPDSRAVLYEQVTYTKRKVEDFAKLLSGLKRCEEICKIFENANVSNSPMLEKIVKRVDNGGCFPNLSNELAWFENNFDVRKAKAGNYEPVRGVNEQYDEMCDSIEETYSQLEEYKVAMCRELRISTGLWKYVNTKPEARDKFLIELPVSVRVPGDFEVKGKRGSGSKQINKYTTSVVMDLVSQLERAQEMQKDAKQNGMRFIFQKFDSLRPLWVAAAHATGMLDALASLAAVSSLPGYCRPEILSGESPEIRIEAGRHPNVDNESFIPNTLVLGGKEDSRVLLLSGPNMGGKSTLLRQTCAICILAQIGCYVPAEACAITPLDRIFTRLGASDSILQGQSTFFVELAETAAALRGASSRSLVIMDELGRGTATFDGTAIASATVQYLVDENKCLALFATHYHSLLADWEHNKKVRLGHMECMVELDTGKEQIVTFLYTLGNGICPRSFGINVARLAGLPQEVIDIAMKKSAEFEAEMELSVLDRLKSATENGDLTTIERLWISLQSQ